MNKRGTVTGTEKLLLGVTALFLCGLMAAAFQDRQQAESAPLMVETERTVSQEETLGDLKPVELNTAAEEELMTLPGIGEELARRIVEYREKNGPFAAVEEIMGVSGIGEKKFEEIRMRITVEEAE